MERWSIIRGKITAIKKPLSAMLIMYNTTEMIYPDGSKIEQAYDVAGRLTSFTNKRSQHIHYEYDTDGRMIKKITPEGVVDFRYDERDRLSEIEAADFHYKYQYGIPSCVSGYKTILQEENLKNRKNKGTGGKRRLKSAGGRG